jgi:hypothetical protein
MTPKKVGRSLLNLAPPQSEVLAYSRNPQEQQGTEVSAIYRPDRLHWSRLSSCRPTFLMSRSAIATNAHSE